MSKLKQGDRARIVSMPDHGKQHVGKTVRVERTGGVGHDAGLLYVTLEGQREPIWVNEDQLELLDGGG